MSKFLIMDEMGIYQDFELFPSDWTVSMAKEKLVKEYGYDKDIIVERIDWVLRRCWPASLRYCESRLIAEAIKVGSIPICRYAH